MRLVDIIKEPTKFINPVITKAKETAKEAVIKEPRTETDPVKASANEIELAAEINANLYATLVETPLTTFNAFNYRLGRKKAKKTITDPKLLAKELDDLEKLYQENKKYIDLEDSEFDRFRKIALLKAQKDGGKVNEALDMASAIIAMIAKRAVIFVRE